MSTTDAAQILEVPVDATPAQLEARFIEVRTKLEDKIAKAPTAGLKAKYRESLEEITLAFETLTLAADASSLPVTQRATAPRSPVAGSFSPDADKSPSTGRGHVPEVSRKPHSENRKSSREFTVVALLAVAVLGAGAWWVVKSRNEKAEAARTAERASEDAARKAAAEKADAARAVEAARIAAENQKRREQEERDSAATATKAEAERRDKLAALLRSSLAELKIGWDATEQAARSAERRTSELRSAERDLNRGGNAAALARVRAELAAQEQFTQWLTESLPRHPARVAIVQTEELLSARAVDEAQASIERARAEQAKLDAEMAAKRKSIFQLSTTLSVSIEPADSSWEITDAYGDVHRGSGSRELADIPFGAATARFKRTGFTDKVTEFTVKRDQPAQVRGKFAPPVLRADSVPEGADVYINGKHQGVTPAVINLGQPGTFSLEFRQAGFRSAGWNSIQAGEGASLSYVAQMRNRGTPTVGFGFTRRPDKTLSVSVVSSFSPAEEAGLKADDRIDAIFNGSAFVPATELSNLEFLRLLAKPAGDAVRLRIGRAGESPREVSLVAKPLGEIEDSEHCFIHYLRGVKLLDMKLRRTVNVAGTEVVVGEWNRLSVRVRPGRHQVTLEGVGAFAVDVKPGEEVYVQGTMSGFRLLSREEGERLAAKLHHVPESETRRPAPVLP